MSAYDFSPRVDCGGHCTWTAQAAKGERSCVGADPLVRPPCAAKGKVSVCLSAFRLFGPRKKLFQPPQHPLPAVAMSLGLFEVAAEPFLRDPDARSRPRFFGPARMQSVHGFRFEFPSHDGFLRACVAANPRV